jgi:hypothetical protein
MPLTFSERESFAIAFPESDPFAIADSFAHGEPDAEAQSLGRLLSDGESAAIPCAVAERCAAAVRVPPVLDPEQPYPASEHGLRDVGTRTLAIVRRDRERPYRTSTWGPTHVERVHQRLARPPGDRRVPVRRARAVGCGQVRHDWETAMAMKRRPKGGRVLRIAPTQVSACPRAPLLIVPVPRCVTRFGENHAGS